MAFVLMLLTFSVAIAVCILSVYAHWKLYIKAGLPGWYCLVPIYGPYMLYRTIWNEIAYYCRIGISSLLAILFFAIAISTPETYYTEMQKTVISPQYVVTETGKKVLNNELLIVAAEDINSDLILNIAEKKQVSVDASLSEVGIFHFMYASRMSYEELKREIILLERNPEIAYAMCVPLEVEANQSTTQDTTTSIFTNDIAFNGLLLCAALLYLTNMVFVLLYSIKLAKYFGKSNAFALGLLFAPLPFELMLVNNFD